MYRAVRSILFRLDAEAAHDLTVRQIERLQSVPSLLRAVERSARARAEGPEVALWGLRFRNPVGIAAGFDKNARMVPFLAALGFGFVEVGTVTFAPQAGNPQPRMFRVAEHGAIINRLGFNNEGAVAVAARLESLWNHRGRGESSGEQVPVFANLGKNRDVPLAGAAESYRMAYRMLAPLAHGVVINVSSPNTPGLRELQSPDHLRELLTVLRQERLRLAFRAPGDHPLLVKVAPDLSERELADVATVCLELADGIVATNTTVSRPGMSGAEGREAGGLSGRPLLSLSTEVVRRLRQLAGAGYPLIGVGGIFDAAGARAKLEAGADLVQVYTGFVYRGPRLPLHIAAGLRSNR
ncbi:MAG TPA: quinone-dependent dihydroorotate dehydrogenase [Thermoanaerobaculia bacterium]|nr:quinone-dependent dihydroorotate dehydrogenase [Thermoanaerobaculia bacterium]